MQKSQEDSEVHCDILTTPDMKVLTLHGVPLWRNRAQRHSEMVIAAKGIYFKFVDQNAPTQINLKAHTTAALGTILSKPEMISCDMFRAARGEILQLIRADNYQRFVKSEAFGTMLGKLLSHR